MISNLYQRIVMYLQNLTNFLDRNELFDNKGKQVKLLNKVNKSKQIPNLQLLKRRRWKKDWAKFIPRLL